MHTLDAPKTENATLEPGPFEAGELVKTNAAIFGDNEAALAAKLLYGPASLSLTYKEHTETVPWLPGHLLDRSSYGPRPARVMVISKNPLREDALFKANFASEALQYLLKYVADHGIDYSQWYATCLVKFKPPDHVKGLKASWVKECLWFLAQEIDIVKPDIILMLGTDVVKALFSTSKNMVSLGRVRGVDSLTVNGIPAVAAAHPGSVVKEPMRAAGFKKDIKMFIERLNPRDVAEEPADYLVLENIEELRAVVDAVVASGADKIAIDCEWGSLGEKSDYLRGKLRCVQFSVAARTAFTVHMRKEGLEWVFGGTEDEVRAEMKRLLCRKGVKLVAHAMRADLKFLMHELKLDLDDQVMAGFDTMLMYHMFGPHEEYGLNHLILMFTTMSRYDMGVEAWLKAHGFNKAMLRKWGYAMVPDDVLLPYAGADVDALMRIEPILEDRLKNMPFTRYGDYELFGAPCHTVYDLYRYLVQPAAVPINGMEMEGFPADEDRLTSLVTLFQERYDTMLDAFRAKIKWPAFNPRSVFQVRYFLYGKELCGKKNIVPPEGAVILGLSPVKTTDKPSKDWDKLSDAELRVASPSTDSETLDILAAEDGRAEDLKNLRFIDQMVKNFLRPGEEDDETGETVFESGLVSVIDDDGRIRTSISQVTDTGRYRSCVHRDTKIVTRRGTIPISEVVVGDEVWTHKRRWRGVTACYVHPAQPMVNVKLSTGYILTCTENHKVLSSRGVWKEIRNANGKQERYEQRGPVRTGGDGIRDDAADRGADSRRVQDKLDDGAGHGGCARTGGRLQETEEAALPALETGREQPELRKIQAGDGLFRLQGISDAPGGPGEIFRTPDRSCRGPGDASAGPATVGAGAPYRRGPAEQRVRQPGDHDECRPQADTREVPAGAAGPYIEEIHAAGVHAVYDITVAEDCSYAACGVFHHNSSPNLQNLPNKQEVVLKRLFCPEDKIPETDDSTWGKSVDKLKAAGLIHPGYYELRSCFMAGRGYVLVEADYQQAELNVLAYLAGDREMMAIMGDPKRDLHSEMAVTAFQLPCHPDEVKARFPKHRVMAKNVNFGIAYGRGAAALVRQIKTEGITIEKQEAQKIIDVFFEKFPRVKNYMDDMRECVLDPGYVETPFGRRRRFYPTRNKGALAANERQAINMPIQGTVADCLTLSLINFWEYRKTLDDPDLFRVTLPVHDALFFQIAPCYLTTMVESIIPACMSELCQVPRIGLKLKADISAPMERWKVKCDTDELLKRKAREWQEIKERCS